MELWRISNHTSLNGEGGRRFRARWHSGGAPIVYLAESPPGALIEILVHLELSDVTLPPSYTLLRISVPDRLPIPLLDIARNPNGKDDEAVTRTLGDAWLESQKSVLARVPSAILPSTFNYLLNPKHPGAARIAITAAYPAPIDLRLLRNRRA